MRNIVKEYLKRVNDFNFFDKVGIRKREKYLLHNSWFEQIYVGVNGVTDNGYDIGITHSMKNVQNMEYFSEGISIYITDDHWIEKKYDRDYGLLYNPIRWVKFIRKQSEL